MAELSEWLKLMLAEVARKREEEAQARTEDAERARTSPGKEPRPRAAGARAQRGD